MLSHLDLLDESHTKNQERPKVAQSSVVRAATSSRRVGQCPLTNLSNYAFLWTTWTIFHKSQQQQQKQGPANFLNELGSLIFTTYLFAEFASSLLRFFSNGASARLDECSGLHGSLRWSSKLAFGGHGRRNRGNWNATGFGLGQRNARPLCPCLRKR